MAGLGVYSGMAKGEAATSRSGSITELQSQLLLVRDLKYISSEKFTELTDQTYYVHKLIFGLIKHSRNFT